jgi:cytosine/adenosine deaminase-related metal-dependent hydrolase
VPPKQPIDPLTSPKLALAGRIVTMDDALRVIPRGVLYLEKGAITAVQPEGQSAPAGFETVKVVKSGGTIYPGLIELHNHLSYNVLRLWDVPKTYTNRDQWAGTAEYRRLITGPMTVLGKHGRLRPDKLPALVRYVECKCLLGGVTTSQGIGLFSNAGVRRFYKGIVRNVEQSGDEALPDAFARIPDVDAKSFDSFRHTLASHTCCLLHLSEGTDDAARRHFEALKPKSAQSGLAKSLAGIHCAALLPEHFAEMAAHQASMVWSPLSNLLLYGQTADVKAAKQSKVRIGIGPDWSPSGSKNLLGELKVARWYSQFKGGLFEDEQLVAMATRDAAAILGWQDALGTLEKGRRADLLVMDGVTKDPYALLLEAAETDIRLVMINGVPRYGVGSLLKSLGVTGESVTVGGRARAVYLEQETLDEAMKPITLADARKTLTDALKNLPRLAKEVEHPSPAKAMAMSAAAPQPVWMLALDEVAEGGVELRPRLPGREGGKPTGFSLGASMAPFAAAPPISQIVGPLVLDKLTVADDGDFVDRLKTQKNLPDQLKKDLPKLY